MSGGDEGRGSMRKLRGSTSSVQRPTGFQFDPALSEAHMLIVDAIEAFHEVAQTMALSMAHMDSEEQVEPGGADKVIKAWADYQEGVSRLRALRGLPAESHVDLMPFIRL